MLFNTVAQMLSARAKNKIQNFIMNTNPPSACLSFCLEQERHLETVALTLAF